MKKQCDKLNIKYKRFRGIDGSNYILSNKEKNFFINSDFNYKKSKGVVGCALSLLYLE